MHRAGSSDGERSGVRAAVLLACVCLTLAACRVLPRPTPMDPIDDGVVITAGVTILDAQGKFVLMPHQPFRRPFRVAAPDQIIADNLDLDGGQAWVTCVLSHLTHLCNQRFPSLDAAWPAFEKAGARRVRVEVSGRGSYHGLLYLGDAPPDSAGPSGKHYRIEVPLEVLARTMDGGVEVVFGMGIARNIGYVRTWILWLSMNPLRERTF